MLALLPKPVLQRCSCGLIQRTDVTQSYMRRKEHALCDDEANDVELVFPAILVAAPRVTGPE